MTPQFDSLQSAGSPGEHGIRLQNGSVIHTGLWRSQDGQTYCLHKNQVIALDFERGRWMEQTSFNPENAVLICADSWAKLRKCDVYRLFDAHEESRWRGIYRCLIKHRPEFAFEAREVMADLEADANSFYGDIPGTTC